MDLTGSRRTLPRSLAAALAIGTFVALSLARFARVPGLAGGDLGAPLLAGTLAVTVASAAFLTVRGYGLRTTALVSLGPAVGCAAYLAVAVAVFGPSTDSPTWLLFLLFVGVCLALGGVGSIAGALFRRLGAGGIRH